MADGLYDKYDLRENGIFGIGDEVVPLDPSYPRIFGHVVGIVSRDRVDVEWPFGHRRGSRKAFLESLKSWATGSPAQTPTPTPAEPLTKNPFARPEVAKYLEVAGLEPQVIQIFAEEYEKYLNQQEAKRSKGPPKSGRWRTQGSSTSVSSPMTPTSVPETTDFQLPESSRKSAIARMRRSAQLLHGLRLKDHAQVVDHAADVAESLDALYMNPKTRVASSDGVARKAMLNSISATVGCLDVLRFRKAGLKKLAADIEADFLGALTYEA